MVGVRALARRRALGHGGASRRRKGVVPSSTASAVLGLGRFGPHPADADLAAHLRGQFELELTQVLADELRCQLIRPDRALLVLEDGHGDDLVAAAGDRVIADEPPVAAERVGEPLVQDAHEVADEAGTHLVLAYGGVHRCLLRDAGPAMFPWPAPSRKGGRRSRPRSRTAAMLLAEGRRSTRRRT